MICVAAIIVNLTSVPFTKTDWKVYYAAEKRCIEVYPDNPCMEKFIKKETNVYNVICGKGK